MRRVVFAGLLVAASGAVANGQSGLQLELGKKVEINVGYARGWMCDDPSFVQADLVTRGDHNVWIVTGVKLGQTMCRVGTDPFAYSYVFDVRVVAPKKR